VIVKVKYIPTYFGSDKSPLSSALNPKLIQILFSSTDTLLLLQVKVTPVIVRMDSPDLAVRP
jgi:hypothetical protein